MKKIFIISLGILLFSCDNKKEEFKKEAIGKATFEVPTNWKKTNIKGIDSKITSFITSSSDTVYFEYGAYNNPFNESKIIVNDSLIYKTLKENSFSESVVFSTNKELDNNQGVFLDNYYYYDTINNHRAKVMLPKKSKKGQMGIYFEDVDGKKNNFSVYTLHPLKGVDSLNFFKLMGSIQIK
ncbi:hypothetical protein P2W68_03735 [Chryseobacterium arthrosphaerae]|uniref:hypothetical protein n=1 Tax=Chryseobacterium arthrosphaerae TaxID=651561 RepID=UPI0023E1B037|nr:hypothetical protein [Chryseobacterium arthrosphaerae]WES98726.1 hypothetical protein P2W68_03735 [Chryseobacterium arthrosphaerae]